MKEYTQEEIDKALDDISKMDHYTMCKLWRFAPAGSEIYFRTDGAGNAFTKRLFDHFGGFTPEISKELGWNKLS